MAAASVDPLSHFSVDLASELEALGAIFGGEGEFEVEGLPPGSEYCCEVQVKPEGLAVGLKFSLHDTYPDKTPKVEILPTEKNVSDDPLVIELLQLLYQSAQESCGQPVMYMLVDIAKEWLGGRSLEGEGEEEDRDDDDDEQEDSANKDEMAQPLTHKTNKKPAKLHTEEEEDYKKKGKKKKPKKPIKDDLGPEKKSRMKTASEVISRIQWDRQVHKEDFIVGYLDRFRGTIEKPFTAFSWVDIASVDDYDTLAIPRHRIQYFKYKDRVVWDKNERLDDVFGSTGSKKTILNTVEAFSKENQSVEKKEVSDAVGDDSVVEEATEEPDAKPEEKSRRSSRAPNYFFAIRITDAVIRRCVQRIQDAICDDDPRFEDWCSHVGSLHITLCTMRLDNRDDMSKAIYVLKSLQSDISALLSPVTMLRFQGLDQFYGRVLFTPPEECPALTKLSHMLQTALGEAGINLAGNHPQFNPHMTIFKMTRNKTEEFGGTPFASDLYERFQQAFIGVQPIDAIHLCSMERPLRADGFYYCLASMDIQSEH